MKPGAELDAWCTACKEDRVHRVVAVVEGKPKKVECLSCKGVHLYRAPKASGKVGALPSKRAANKEATNKRHAADDALARWEKTVAGKPYEQFRAYRMDLIFSPGELIRHTKFGDGVVASVTDGNKCDVLFRDGNKTLAMATTLAS
jgi:hypothetical protein